MNSKQYRFLWICLFLAVTPLGAEERENAEAPAAQAEESTPAAEDIPADIVAYLYNVLVSTDGGNFDFSASPAADFQKIEVKRQGKIVPSRQNLPLLADDSVTTQDKVIAQLCYSAECNPLALVPPKTTVVLKSRTDLEILSETSALGVFVKKHEAWFRVHLPYVIAGSEGTQFYVNRKKDETLFAVIDGTVKLRPGEVSKHHWDPVILRNQQTIITPDQEIQPNIIAVDIKYYYQNIPTLVAKIKSPNNNLELELDRLVCPGKASMDPNEKCLNQEDYRQIGGY